MVLVFPATPDRLEFPVTHQRLTSFKNRPFLNQSIIDRYHRLMSCLLLWCHASAETRSSRSKHQAPMKFDAPGCVIRWHPNRSRMEVRSNERLELRPGCEQSFLPLRELKKRGRFGTPRNSLPSFGKIVAANAPV